MSDENALSKKMTAAEMVDAYLEAIDIITAAYGELRRAKKILKDAFGNGIARSDYPEESSYRGSTKLEDVLNELKKSAWKSVVNKIEIRKVMSIKKAKELDESLEDHRKLPELTLENIRAMSEGMIDEKDDLFKDSVLEVFEWLRPGASDYNQHKTNVRNGRYALGPKIVLTNVVYPGYGSNPFRVGEYSNKYLIAVDNVFHNIDGNMLENGYVSPLVDAINTCRGGKGKTDYFSFKVYKNGNLHLEFTRLDLVARLNAIAGGTRFTGENPVDLKRNPKKKDYSGIKRDGFFQTQPREVARMLEIADIQDGDMVLEPSAGEGAIVHGVIEYALVNFCKIDLTMIEKNPTRAWYLREKYGLSALVLQDDFLTCTLTVPKYNKILMNPPFERGQDIDHVRRAYDLLATGGTLIAIMSEGSFYRNDNQTMAFKTWLISVGGDTEKLPAGSFKDAGTMINARIVVISKPF